MNVTPGSIPIDIILPVSGNYVSTKKCIDSVFKNTLTPFRLIIVDNGLKDPALTDFLTTLKQNNENIILVSKDKNMGFSACVNKGLEISKSEIVAILSNDVIVSKNWLSKLVKGFAFAPNAGIIGPRCNNNLIPNISVNFNEKIEIPPQLDYFNKFLENSNNPDFSEIPYTVGYCLLIKREVIMECGGFDTIYGDSVYFSDFDFCFKASRKGFSILTSNKTIIYRDNSELGNIRISETRIPLNFTIFKRKWQKHKDIKFIHPNMFPETKLNVLKKDDEEFYFNENLKPGHKKYLLINPPIVDTKYFAEGWRVPTTGILRVAHYLIDNGDKINFYDFEPYYHIKLEHKLSLGGKNDLYLYGKPMDDFVAYIKNLQDKNIDEIFITAIITFHYPHVILQELVDNIREVFGDTKITFGGLYPSLCPDEIKKLGVEIHNGPYYSADSYRPLIELTNENEYAVMRVVKGCPRTCSYCVVPNVEGRILTHYQKENIIKQFHEFYSMGFTTFKFWDSNLLFGRENLYILMDYLIKYGYTDSIFLDFSYGLEFSLVDDDFINRINQFTLRNPLFVPLESSEYELYKDKFHRPSTHLGQITKAVKKLQDANYKYMSFFVMLGLPYQTIDQVLKTLIFGWRLNLFPIMMMYTPIPGTEDYQQYLDFYKDKEYWELNPYLYPCESDILTSETLMFINQFDRTSLRYTEEDGFYIQIYKASITEHINQCQLYKMPFNENNFILKRLKELILEDQVRPEEVSLDDKTFRYFHGLRI